MGIRLADQLFYSERLENAPAPPPPPAAIVERLEPELDADVARQPAPARLRARDERHRARPGRPGHRDHGEPAATTACASRSPTRGPGFTYRKREADDPQGSGWGLHFVGLLAESWGAVTERRRERLVRDAGRARRAALSPREPLPTTLRVADEAPPPLARARPGPALPRCCSSRASTSAAIPTSCRAPRATRWSRTPTRGSTTRRWTRSPPTTTGRSTADDLLNARSTGGGATRSTTASPTTSTRRTTRAFQQQTSGAFVGVGVSVRDERSSRAGLRGDRGLRRLARPSGRASGPATVIVAVDGRPLKGLSHRGGDGPHQGPGRAPASACTFGRGERVPHRPARARPRGAARSSRARSGATPRWAARSSTPRSSPFTSGAHGELGQAVRDRPQEGRQGRRARPAQQRRRPAQRGACWSPRSSSRRAPS